MKRRPEIVSALIPQVSPIEESPKAAPGLDLNTYTLCEVIGIKSRGPKAPGDQHFDIRLYRLLKKPTFCTRSLTKVNSASL